MTRLSYDVVVVGAGPGGTSAANHLARRGLRVLIVERERFPRPKACGDALVPRAVRAVQSLGVELVHGRPIVGAHIVHMVSHRVAYRDFETLLGGRGHVVERSWLDNELLLRALEAGATRMQATVGRVEDGRRGARVWARTPEGERRIEARFVVVASGAAPQIAGIDTPPEGDGRVWGVARRGYVKVSPPLAAELQLFFPLMHDGRALPGYAWIFPAGPDVVNLGVGLTRTRATRAVSAAAVYEDFIRAQRRVNPVLSGAEAIGEAVSAPIPLSLRRSASESVLYVGDAAGLANPFTGEGIGVALASGELAAAAIGEGGAHVAARYRRELARAVRRDWARAGIFESFNPAFALDRAGDLLLEQDRAVSRALERLVWDIGNRGVQTSPSLRRSSPAIEEVRARIVAECGAAGALYGGLVEELATDEHARFGRFIGFLDSRVGRTQPTREAVLGCGVILESVGLVAYLQDDLSGARVAAPAQRPAGCDVMAVVLADLLNAAVMAALLRMEHAWAARLSSLSGGLLMARARGGARVECAERDLLAAAAAMLAGELPSVRESSTLRSAARHWLRTWEAAGPATPARAPAVSRRESAFGR